MAEFFPGQVQYGNTCRTDLNTVAASNFLAFGRLSLQANEAEVVHDSHDGPVRAEVPAPASRHVDNEDQNENQDYKLNPEERGQARNAP
jgi:hypothetical protein